MVRGVCDVGGGSRWGGFFGAGGVLYFHTCTYFAINMHSITFPNHHNNNNNETTTGTDREASGQCIAGLTLETTTLPIPTSPPPYAYTFMRRHPQVHPSAADEGPREDVQNVFKVCVWWCG